MSDATEEKKRARIKGDTTTYEVVVSAVHAGLVYLKLGEKQPVFPMFVHQVEYVK